MAVNATEVDSGKCDSVRSSPGVSDRNELSGESQRFYNCIGNITSHNQCSLRALSLDGARHESQ